MSCVLRGSPLVRAVVHHALLIAENNSVIGSNALFCCERYEWVAADLVAGKTDVSNSNFQKSAIINTDKTDIRVAIMALYIMNLTFTYSRTGRKQHISVENLKRQLSGSRSAVVMTTSSVEAKHRD